MSHVLAIILHTNVRYVTFPCFSYVVASVHIIVGYYMLFVDGTRQDVLYLRKGT